MRRYRWRVSGALYDRIDMAIDVPAVTVTDMAPRTGDIKTCERMSSIRDRVALAYRRQIERQGKANARLGPADVERHCMRSAAAESLLAQAMSRMSLSARGYHRVVKVARTIAYWAGCDSIEPAHVAEAIGYRREIGAAS